MTAPLNPHRRCARRPSGRRSRCGPPSRVSRSASLPVGAQCESRMPSSWQPDA
ncbi:hypothetical protein SHJG_4733 [Streptomyces hygroscopicus subsp. jinggangensis 5008]|nr:hypothetical protein SHJG_4733 [Streptomyces hygroscopicus subsp. jinggangensis 5008]AGF64159.1 hypothetical protein SHJGH_4495 [Streptomyces hygroscopicus subsp. jinggangensis TL01]